MSHRLIDLNDDLRRLRDDGYNIDIASGFLLASDIPYVNERREVRRGTLVASLDLNGDITNRPSDHTIKFVGDYPCDDEGKPLAGLRHSSGEFRLTEHITAQHTFSSKPTCGYYADFHEKIKTYAAMLCGHAAKLEPGATPRTYRVVEPREEESPFNYLDTASSRAEINVATQKLAVEKVAIVGLGGTGSYVLDLVAKTPVKEIHIFDGDKFSSHNAFRSPGAASKDDLHRQLRKVEYLKAIYSRMHRGIKPYDFHVDASNIGLLKDMSFVFLCVDGGREKRYIVEKLEEFGVDFVDTGMGLYSKVDTLGGTLRVVTSEPENRDVARRRISFGSEDGPNEYDRNIQIADLNALNAFLAVIRWKKLRGFYFDFKRERFCSYTIGSNLLISEDIVEPR